MDKKSHPGLNRRNFVGSLAAAAAGRPLLAEAADQKPRPDFTDPLSKGKPRPDFTDPLSKEKLPPAIEASKPNGLNLIVIICDTFRYDYCTPTATTGSRLPISTPWRKKAANFVNCYADGLPTIPARRVMHTGRSILPDREKWRPLRQRRRHPGRNPRQGRLHHRIHRRHAPLFQAGHELPSRLHQLGVDPRAGDRRLRRAARAARSTPKTHVPRHLLNPGYREMRHPVPPEHEGPAGRGGLFLRRVLRRRRPAGCGTTRTTAGR